MNRKGFTLIELLVVVAVIGVLSTVVLASLSQARDKAKFARTVAQFEQIEKALFAAYLEENRTDWWTENDLSLGGNPTLQEVLDIESPNPGYAISNYFKNSPNNIIGNSQYKYDNDDNPVTDCNSGQPHQGINLFVDGIGFDFREQIDEYIDGSSSPTCGKITYNPSSPNDTMFWNISSDGNF